MSKIVEGADGEKGGMYIDGKWVVFAEGEDQVADTEAEATADSIFGDAPEGDAFNALLDGALKLEEQVEASKRRIADLEDVVRDLQRRAPTPTYRVTFGSFTTVEIEDAKSQNREDALVAVIPVILDIVKLFMGEKDVTPRAAPHTCPTPVEPPTPEEPPKSNNCAPPPYPKWFDLQLRVNIAECGDADFHDFIACALIIAFDTHNLPIDLHSLYLIAEAYGLMNRLDEIDVETLGRALQLRKASERLMTGLKTVNFPPFSK